jgi:hypothetical protein
LLACAAARTLTSRPAAARTHAARGLSRELDLEGGNLGILCRQLLAASF